MRVFIRQSGQRLADHLGRIDKLVDSLHYFGRQCDQIQDALGDPVCRASISTAATSGLSRAPATSEARSITDPVAAFTLSAASWIFSDTCPTAKPTAAFAH